MVFCGLFSSYGFAQKIKLDVKKEPLNKVLVKIRDGFKAEFSFNDSETSKYIVTCKKSFGTVAEALEFVLKDFPLNYELNGSVYVIFKKVENHEPELIPVKKEKPRYRVSGSVIDQKEGECLPFSLVSVNGIGLVCDQNGKFSYVSQTDSLFHLKVSHLGYMEKDTVVSRDLQVVLKLSPSDRELEEVIVEDLVIENFNETVEEGNEVKINHRIAKYLPGSNDNSIFNILRLQPGIMASAEQANDLIIWGAYTGQSQVLFDGFTLFGLKNFNDNISAVNPFVVQHLRILKGGYDATYGGRVGGIVDITGKQGRVGNPELNLSISNFTLNGLFQVPVSKNSSLLIAGRKTYYDLYADEDIPVLKKLYENTGNPDWIEDFSPVYDFGDINLKYSILTKDYDVFYISLMRGKDNFAYDFDVTTDRLSIQKATSEQNIQNGASVYYGKSWNNGFHSTLLFAYSGIVTDFNDSLSIKRKITNRSLREVQTETENSTEEYKAELKTEFPINQNHKLESGLSYIANTSRLREDTFGIPYIDQYIQGDHLSMFTQAVMTNPNIRVTYGARLNYLPYLNTFYFEPRLSLTTNPEGDFRFNVSTGKYKQFVTKTSILDEAGNYRYVWTVADNESIPVVDASHFVTGFFYQYKKFQLNIEAYYKKTKGLSRYMRSIGELSEGVYEGSAQTIGADLFVKQSFLGHSVWLSYSLGETSELFDYHLIRLFRKAPHNQTHELKLAGIFDIKPFYISSDWVWGSGFSVFTGNIEDPLFETGSYSRWDASAVFQFSRKKVSGEIGLSVLNILNKDNIKLSNFERVPADQVSSITIYNEPVPFTPTLFLKIVF
jgi:hypothetical protein